MSEPTNGADAPVVFTDVHLAFGTRRVLTGLSCQFPRGKISVILGGSGSGKTTVLRLIGGLIHPDRGEIRVAGHEIARLSETELYDVRAKIGMLFQGGALLNSLSVFDNVAFPLREHARLSAREIADEVHLALDAVGLTDVDRMLPGQLSGGMVKRAALARALIMRPEIVLCDEPFSGLDPVSVKRVEALFERVNERFGATMLVTSHHIPSTVRMADQVLMLIDGGTVQGTPAELLQSTEPHVRSFLHEESADVDDDEPPAIWTGTGGR